MMRVLFAGLMLAAAEALAQLPCMPDALEQATNSYKAGRFDEVVLYVRPCLEERLPRARVIEFRTLLAKAHLQADRLDEVRSEIKAILRLDPNFDPGAPPRLVALVNEIRGEEQVTQVASVSKTNESLREAPATVVVITADQIQRRGYLDLEQLLHDLPGFDIARLNGDIYANIYQRGYRSPNDRLLLLVDGVEQNELSSGIVYLSRQYPLSNIDRVEVIYGPASTMYGANAYTGVISILTKDAEASVGDKNFGLAGRLTGGGYGAGAADFTASGKGAGGAVAWSVAANIHHSRERDLSGFPEWDYRYRSIDYISKLKLTALDAQLFLLAGKCLIPSPYYQCRGNIVELTPAGGDLVRGLDRALITDNGLGFDDRAANWGLEGKLRLSNLTIGVQSWKSREGIASAFPARLITGDTSWTPRGTSVYFRYYLPMERVKLNAFTRYEQTAVQRDGSRFDYLHNYANGFLSLWSLTAPCKAPSDQIPVGCPPAPAHPWVEQVTFGGHSTQLRSELNAVMDWGETWTGVGGLEVAKSSIESQLEQIASGPGQLFHNVTTKPEQIEHTDIALFAQGAWKPRPSLKLVLAGRLTHNEINHKAGASGFGTLFTPRLGVIYLPKKSLVLKAIYSEAFKDPTDGQKFGIVSGVNQFRGNGLKPETVRNLELSAIWERRDDQSVEASVYQARYGDVVALAGVPACSGSGCRRYENRDQIRIRGLQATARSRFASAEWWANYTYVQPILINPHDLFGKPLLDDAGLPIATLRVADIASSHLNAGVGVSWRAGFAAGLRGHYVSSRPTGSGTTESGSPLRRTNGYATADIVISNSRLVPRATLQLIVDNALDKQYFDPGSDPTTGVARVLQAGRTVHLRLIYALPGAGRP